MRNQRAGHTLQTTALIHEAHLPPIDAAHFFTIADLLTRQILMDLARESAYQKCDGRPDPGCSAG